MFDDVTDLQQQNRSKYWNISKTKGRGGSINPPPPAPTTTIVLRWGYDLACTSEGYEVVSLMILSWSIKIYNENIRLLRTLNEKHKIW